MHQATFHLNYGLQITHTAQSKLLPRMRGEAESNDSDSHFQWHLPQPQAVTLQISYSGDYEMQNEAPAVRVRLITEQVNSSSDPNLSGSTFPIPLFTFISPHAQLHTASLEGLAAALR